MKQRFVMLDGLRGVAAVAVVFYHLSTSFGITHYLPNGPLAVDFFFCLSGFVLASAHGEQFAEGVLGLRRFMLLRVIRVGPMVLLGTILGAISLPWLMTDWAPPRDLRATTTFLSFLTLPSIRGGKMFWVNAVFWSLLAELIVNALYGAIGRRLRNIVLALLLAALGLTYIVVSVTRGTAVPTFDTVAVVPLTIVRASWSFFLGIALLRVYRRYLGDRHMPAWISLLLLIVMLSPLTTFHVNRSGLIAVFTIVPATVLLGAMARPRRATFLVFLGDASFPLYAIHAPVANVVGTMIARLGPLAQILLGGLLAATLIWIAGAVAKRFDEPLRRHLRRRLVTGR